MKYKVTVEVGKQFEFDDIEADSEDDACNQGESRAMDLVRYGEVNIRGVNAEPLEEPQD